MRITYEVADRALNFVEQPSDTQAGEQIDPPITVEIVDQDGDRIDDATEDITLIIANDPSGGDATLSGTLTVAADDGLATFADISIDEPGDGYTLEATADDAASTVSDPFDILPLERELAFDQQPTDTVANAAIEPAITVRVEDDEGNLLDEADDAVTLAIANNPGGGTLAGTTTVNAVDGIATFGGLAIDEPGDGYTLEATAGDIASATSEPFDILAPDFTLIAAYYFDEQEWTGEPGEVEDATGNGNDGTAIGDADTAFDDPARGDEDFGTCQYGVFGGDGDYVDVPGLSNTLNDSASLAFWIRTEQTGAAEGWRSPGVAGVEEPGGTDDIFWGWLDDTGRIGISVGNDFAAEQKSTSPINDGTWRHVVLTRDAGTGETQIYIDGALDQTGTTGTGGIGNPYSSIGRIEDSEDPYFEGDLDEVRVYEGVIDATTVDALYTQERNCIDEPELTCSVSEFDDELGSEWDTESVSGSFGEPRAVEGALRLTDATTNVSTRATIMNALPWNGNRVEVTFRYFSYGGSTASGSGGDADGIAVTFSDAAVAPVPGGFGGSLGYAQRDDVDGFAGGWLGIGIDEFGNFSNPTEGRQGGPGFIENAVAIRADGEGGQGYEYIAGTGSLDPPLSSPNVENRDELSGDVYRITVDTTEPGTALVRVERDTSGTGSDFEVLLDEDIAEDQDSVPPDEVYVSFTGATGGETNFHEIDFLDICAEFGIDPDTVDTYEISHSGQAITCIAEPITITALDGSGEPMDAPADTTINLAATTDDAADDGNWVRLVEGGGTFSPGGVGSGAGNYTFPGGEPEVVIAYQYTQLDTDPEAVELAVDDGEASGISDPLSVALAGFRFVNESDGTTTIPDQISGKPSDIDYNASDLGLQAIRASDEDPTVCEGQFDEGETATIELGAECRDPDQCAGEEMEIGGTPIATSDDNGDPGSATAYDTVDLTFDDNAIAPIVLRYPDAGRTRLYARYEIPLADDPDDPEAGAPSGGFMLGTSNEFVWRPFGFHVDVPEDPGSSGPTGETLARAGEAFSLRLRAVIWDGEDFDGDQPAANADLSGNASTPNFGNEADSVSASITPTVAAPADGFNGNLSNTTYTDFGEEDAGEQQRDDIAWDEVGYVDIAAVLDGADYFGAGNVTGLAEAIGRFYPDEFRLTPGPLTQRSQRDCTPEATFTYFGEELAVAFDLSAHALGGNRTRNYDGVYARHDPGTLGELNMASYEGGTAVINDLDPVSATGGWNQGRAEDIEVVLRIDRTDCADDGDLCPKAPYIDLAFGTNPVDPDGVTLGAFDLPESDPDGDHGEVATGRAEIRFGRLRIDGRVGREDRDIALALGVEYWDGGRWRTNDNDGCTAFSFADDFLLASSAGDDDVAGDQEVAINGGSTAIVESDTAVDLSLSSGAAEVTFSAPDATGWVDLRLNAAGSFPFLRIDRDGDGAFDDEPRGRASFGLFGGNPHQIYREELLR